MEYQAVEIIIQNCVPFAITFQNHVLTTEICISTLIINLNLEFSSVKISDGAPNLDGEHNSAFLGQDKRTHADQSMDPDTKCLDMFYLK